LYRRRTRDYTAGVRQRLRSGLIIWAYFTGIGVLLFGYRYLEYVANRETVSPLEPFINEVLTGAWMAALLFPLVARFARRYPIDRSSWLKHLPLHACALVVYSLAHTSLLWAGRSLLYPLFGLRNYDYGIMVARYPMEFFHDVIAYVVTVSILYLFDRHVRAAHLEARLAEARLESLRLQLQPHFLFNALNTISAAVYEDPQKADLMIARLGNLLRATISDADAQVVPLEHEVETLDLYLEIMRERFEDRLRVDVSISPDVQKALAPHLLLQPLVENSIRHGLDPRSNSVTVSITAERDGALTRVRVRDRGRGLPAGGIRKGTGLSNTVERLQQLYGSRHKLHFENCEDGGLLVTVAFPYQL
jgi:two-component system, LytTR family, sensor kinase